MSYEDFDKLKAMYTQLIELVCYAKETDSEDEKIDCFLKMFKIVRACLKFSPYTHFYTQVLSELEEDEYTTQILLMKWVQEFVLIILCVNSNYLCINFE